MSAVFEAVFLTLAMRPVGALLFGTIADRYGRRPALMIDIIAFSVFELASAFAPSLHIFLIMRALFGIAMGGEWGVGAALAFETLPAENRGFFSGLLQEGYVVGYLLAALLYGTLFHFIGWRGMFVIGALPAFLVIYIRTKVEESPAWQQGRGATVGVQRNLGKDIVKYLGTFIFLTVLMFAFNRYSHGTQDVYPTFLQKNRGFSPKIGGSGRDCLQPRRVAGRDLFRLVVGAAGPAEGHRDRRRADNSDDSAVGLPAHRADARVRQLPDAVHGAGRVGSDSGAPE